MANKQINELNEITSPASGDLIPIYDLDEGSSEKTKKITVSNLFLPQGYIDGFQMSNAADTNHDIQITAGICRADNVTGGIELSSAMTKQIDAAWAAGSDAGGMFTGSVVLDTWYHVFVIKKDSDGSIDAGFDTSVTAANIPGGYTGYRRIGSVLTDGSANIIGFSQHGDEFLWNLPVQDVSSNNPGTSAVLATLSVPIDLKVGAFCSYTLRDSSPATTSIILITSPDQSDTNPISTWDARVDSDGESNSFSKVVRTNTSGQVRYRISNSDSGVIVTISTTGWIDYRGKK